MSYTKISALLLFTMTALHWETTIGFVVIDGNCNDVIRLPCKATNQTKKFRYVIWYKVLEIENSPIIKKRGNEVTYFNSTNNLTSVFLGEKETLELHNVQPSDSGTYRCYLAANAGGQNYDSFIGLNISDLSTSWAAVSFILISVTKIILCIIAVGVCDQVKFRTRRKQQDVRRNTNGKSSSCKD
ncbi:uncharacterized protein isoform X2 [Danio rerio]|uniref:Uncharacterized protein isoform X2 n=1 Tax=Danio rerio TaxID=7955 RepID=A0A8M3B224_DANRE|nr:uncharacterized protein LOC100535806 isoform X2 [Danio rerio]|eukprot:XP_009302334.1 uncharacterized protein LOC100535806 isoform X2 [Danio rerio]